MLRNLFGTVTLYSTAASLTPKTITEARYPMKGEQRTEPVFVNVSISRNRFHQAGNRFLTSLKGFQIQALEKVEQNKHFKKIISVNTRNTVLILYRL